jgi:peptide-methionine (R)-S-oxide reductase
MKFILLPFLFLVLTIQCKSGQQGSIVQTTDSIVQDSFIVTASGQKINRVFKSDEEWKALLSPMAYKVLRQKGTERAFTGDYNESKKEGRYGCAGCGMPLFDSKTKFDSGSGWPSFYEPEDKNLIQEDTDYILGYARTEVLCARCGGHLGHVFPDGPEPTGLRYCINSVSLEFIPTNY